jgi:glycosyltransferase involved in cell wall biosynthesis
MRILLRVHELRNNGAVYALLQYAEHLAAGGHRVLLSVPPGGSEALRQRLLGAGVAISHEPQLNVAGFDVAVVATIFGGPAVAALSPTMPVVWSITEQRTPAWDANRPGILRHWFGCATKVVFPTYFLIYEYADILMVSAPYVADVVPIGLKPLEYPPREERGDGIFRILCVGSMYPRKRQIDLINAIRSLDDPEIRCLFVGDPYAIGAADMSYAREHPEQFAFANPPDRAALRDAYAQCDMFSLPSGDETFGLSAIEAGQAGLPVVVSQLPTYRYIWQDGWNALIHPVGDVPALAACIKRLKDNPELRRQLGQNARQVARSFPLEAYTRRFDATLADAIARWEPRRQQTPVIAQF